MTKFGKVTIGQRIKQMREASGMLQRELATKLEIGEGFLSKVENDQKQLKRDDLRKLSRLFKVSIGELETLWLANKVYYLVKDENQGSDALKVVEEQLKYSRRHQ
jgi:transcriptional regulator with XRE-family HTH domain